ncbi:condensation domain-containing protein [Streptomyces sp. CA-181903]|uniref:condensation domain-containing protein n=1 Tax=Streptomyces sp. CA-181903 TaxID=3240055 RepID=UPI003D89BABA
MTALPTGANGKLDRAALPVPSTRRPGLATPYRAPVLPVEQTVAAVLASVLELDQVGLDDDFVELGGDSLTAVRAAARIGDALGLRLPARTVLDHSTPARLASHLAAATSIPSALSGSRAAARDGLLDPGPDGVRLDAGPTHRFLRVNDDRAGGHLPSHGPRFALECHYRIRGPLDTHALSAAVDHLVRHQPALRTEVHLNGDPGQVHQLVRPARGGVLRHVIDPASPAGPVERLAALHAADPLDPAAGHVFTATLVAAGPHDHLLGLRLHHLTSDGCSLNIVEQQLSALYDDVRAGRVPRLPDIDYRALNAPEQPRSEDLSFWAERLTGARPTLLVPPARPAASTVPHDSLLRTRRVPPAVTAAFRALARTERLTPASALYAVFTAVVAADTAQDETLLLAVSAARPEGTAHTAGLYAQAVPVRHRPPGHRT